MRAWYGRHLIAVVAAALAPAACGGAPDAPSGPPAASVQLHYTTPGIPTTPSPEAAFCFRHNVPGGIVVAYPSWQAEERMKEVEGSPSAYGATFEAPVGVEARLAVRDAYLCYADPPLETLWATTGLKVNGTPITRTGPLSPDRQDVPAFVFRVDANGRVTTN